MSRCIWRSHQCFHESDQVLKVEHTSSALNLSSMISAALLPASFRAGVNAIDKTTTIISNLLSSSGNTPRLLPAREKISQFILIEKKNGGTLCPRAFADYIFEPTCLLERKLQIQIHLLETKATQFLHFLVE